MSPRVGPGRARLPPGPVEALQEEEPRVGGGRARLPLRVSPVWTFSSDAFPEESSEFFQNVPGAEAGVLLVSLASVTKPAGVSPIRLEPPPKEEGAPVEQM